MAYTDYDHDTGSSGKMRIRDYGTYVEFWINSGNGTTWFASLDGFKWSVPGDTGNVVNNVPYPAGSGWEKVATSGTFTTGGTVTFYMPATGTSGFGGPTTFSKTIARRPEKPIGMPLTKIGPTSMTFELNDGDNNGSAITARYYQYSKISSFTGAKDIALPVSGIVTRTDLDPNAVYYWRGRVKNAVGLSDYSSPRSATTLAAIWLKVSGIWKRAILWVKVSGVWKKVVLYGKKDGTWRVAK